MKLDKRTYMFLGIGLGLVLLLYVISLFFDAPKQVDFRENFEGDDKRPYGTYLLKNSLPDLLDVDSLVVKEDPLFDLVALQKQEKISYLIINNQFPGDEIDIDELLLFVEKGNHIFLSARYLSPNLYEKLEIDLLPYDDEPADSVTFSIQGDSRHTYKFPSYGMAYFDKKQINGLDTLATDQHDRPVLIRFAFGEGSLILSSTPRIFSNYYMVQEDKRDFIASSLAFVPAEGPVWWDEYYKREKLRFKSYRGGGGNDAPNPMMEYIFSEDGLKWAFWLSVFALLVYAIFESKRKQRVIPVVEPLPNLTLDFTETVGRLYFRSSAHKEIAEKRIRALLAFIREAYFLKTDSFDDKFLKSLAAKSNIPETDIRIMFKHLERIRKSEEISESQLIEANHYIDTFYEIGAR